MTDLNTMTKAAINALLAAPLSASALKKTSHADLVAMFDAMPATTALDADIADARADDTPPTSAAHIVDLPAITAAEHHLMIAFAHCENTPLNGAPKQAAHPSDLSTWVWLDNRKVGDMTTAQKKGVLASLVKKGFVTLTPDSEGDLIGWTDAGFAVLRAILELPLPTIPAKAKPEPKLAPARKLGLDCIMFLPMDTQKRPKAGTKRAAIIDLLRKPAGTSVEEIAAATGWSRAVAGSALYVDVRGSGWGVERRDGRLHLLPEGAM